MPRGGKRAGAGRPPLPVTDRKRRVTLSLPPALWQRLEAESLRTGQPLTTLMIRELMKETRCYPKETVCD